MNLSSPFKLIVAGGRDFDDRAAMCRELNQLMKNLGEDRPLILICGMARGADLLARTIFVSSGYAQRVMEFPAQWEKFGKSAGYRRNVEMAEAADGCLAFWDGESKGTKHMIDIAGHHDLALKVVRY